MIAKDALAVFLDYIKTQRDIERKKKAFTKLTRQTLNYTVISQIVDAATRQAPGFYSVLTFSDGTKWEFGVRRPGVQAQGDQTF